MSYTKPEWKMIAAGSTYKNKRVPRDTWFATIPGGLIVGSMTRNTDDRWVMGMLTLDGKPREFWRPAEWAHGEARDFWEAEYAKSLNG